jgi:serine/alanine adding enzyme
MTDVLIAGYSAADQAAWDAYVANHADFSPYHLTVWREVITRIFRQQPHYRIARNGNGRIVGCLPLVELKSRLFGHYLASMPYFNYGGVLADTPRIETALMDDAAELAGRLGASHVEFRDTRRRNGAWEVREDKVCMQLAMPNSADDLWRNVGAKIRAQVKRPGPGATVRTGRQELLDDFYRVFARNMRDLGTPVYSKSLFSAILEVWPESTIIAVYMDDRPAAAGFVIGDRRHGSGNQGRGPQRMEIPWASSLREHNRQGVNMLLYWEVLKFAIEQGYQIFDFGRSTRDSGTYRFKKQWGAEPLQLYWHYWLRDGGHLPGLSPDNPKYRLAIRTWQHMPLALANLIGPWLVRSLP